MPLAGHQDELGVEEAQNYCSLIVMNDDDEWLGKVELLQLQETDMENSSACREQSFAI